MRQRLTYANVVATIALFAALSTGGAYAASKIKGKQIAKNAITSSKVKNGTLKPDDLQATLRAQIAKGATPGKDGAAGAAGAPGKDGAALAAFTDFGKQALDGGKWTTVGGMDWVQPAHSLDQIAGVYTWPPASDCSGTKMILYQIIVDGNEINFDYGNQGIDSAETGSRATLPNAVVSQSIDKPTPDPGPFGAEVPLITGDAPVNHHLELRLYNDCGVASAHLDDINLYVEQFVKS